MWVVKDVPQDLILKMLAIGEQALVLSKLLWIMGAPGGAVTTQSASIWVLEFGDVRDLLQPGRTTSQVCVSLFRDPFLGALREGSKP